MARSPSRPFVRAALTAVLAALVTVPAQPASAVSAADRYEQYRYATETINLSYEQYLARQNNFRAKGCTNGTKDCRKPSPYNVFDWTDDGCSGKEQLRAISSIYRSLFDGPCRLHDFGYRNFGKGLTLYRHETMRLYIDNRFKSEMIALCNKKYQGMAKYPNWAACQNEASLMYTTVRKIPSNNWGTAGKPPAKPAPSTPSTPVTPPPPAPAPARTYAEQQGSHGVNTFTNYHNASGLGQRIGAAQWVQVTCRVYDPYIASANPDGYWYRIASAPWNNAYYAPANTFMNGDPWGGPYTHNTDFAVPLC